MGVALIMAMFPAGVIWDAKNIITRSILLVVYIVFVGFWMARWVSAVNA